METDKDLLAKKAQKALHTYKHQLVIANLLNNYRDHVEIYTQNSESMANEFNRTDSKEDIEKSLIPWVVQQHEAFIKKK